MNLLPSYRISSLNVQSLTPAAARLYRVANLNSNYLSPCDTIAREQCLSKHIYLILCRKLLTGCWDMLSQLFVFLAFVMRSAIINNLSIGFKNPYSTKWWDSISHLPARPFVLVMVISARTKNLLNVFWMVSHFAIP